VGGEADRGVCEALRGGCMWMGEWMWLGLMPTGGCEGLWSVVLGRRGWQAGC